jgi:hypothetical protein
MQVLLLSKDIAPQLLHVIIFDLKEFKPINTKSNNNIGIRKIMSMMFPKKLIKKLTPKIEITIRVINE